MQHPVRIFCIDKRKRDDNKFVLKKSEIIQNLEKTEIYGHYT